VDAVIHPSLAGQAAVEARYPELAARPHAVVRMGHFRGAYPAHVSREEARAGFGIARDARVLTFLGLVRPYKNVPHLIRTVRSLPPETGAVLLVAGEPLTPELEAAVRAAADEDPRIRLSLRHVPDEDVQRYLLAADLVVLPFTDITNSGSALLALSFDRPILLPGIGAMGELQSLVGAEWVRTYDGELTGSTLCQAIAWAVQRPQGPPNLEPLDWDVIARETRALYQAAVAAPSGAR
jgi:glycosyltransferase involved in cell wall biosynthesis